MTRINSAILVQRLTDEHLLAEHREIKRLPYNLQQAIKSGSINRIPKEFTLGRGHVLFFLDKMQFVWRRYAKIYSEIKIRHFDVQCYADNFDTTVGYIANYWGDYTPKQKEYDLLVERITERINNSPKKQWHYFGKAITKEQAIKILKGEITMATIRAYTTIEQSCKLAEILTLESADMHSEAKDINGDMVFMV